MKKKYIRTGNKKSPSELIQYILSQKGWNLPKPQLILSITGGAKTFDVSAVKKAFQKSLIKAAASTCAWIITGGTNTGVNKLVGEAVKNESDKFNIEIPVIGITNWDSVHLNHKLISNINKTQNDQVKFKKNI